MSDFTDFFASGGGNITERISYYADGRTIAANQGNITLNGTLTASNTISVTNSATLSQSFSAGTLIANAVSNPLTVISPQLGSVSSISTRLFFLQLRCF